MYTILPQSISLTSRTFPSCFQWTHRAPTLYPTLLLHPPPSHPPNPTQHHGGPSPPATPQLGRGSNDDESEEIEPILQAGPPGSSSAGPKWTAAGAVSSCGRSPLTSQSCMGGMRLPCGLEGPIMCRQGWGSRRLGALCCAL